ncbi:MAG TPA: peptide ABC transporter substrate-binding protein [Bacillota bacterium]|nr:peptide ABC transporter substrate-binding protein [Bacillota bacterium]
MRRKKLGFVSLILLFSVTFSMLGGCAKKEEPVVSNGEIDEFQKFVFSSNSEVTGLNPLLNTTAPDNGLQAIILETLIDSVADEDGTAIIKAAAAETWDVSEDGLVYTFKIRDNAVWNDGVPVTADDFVFTYRMMATPEVGSTNAWLFDGVIRNFGEALYEGTKTPDEIGVEAIDEKTVQFTLVKPCAYFLDLLTGAKPVREDKWEEWGSTYGSSHDKIVMNGPFLIDSWDQNVQMTLVKNEDYWDAANVKLDVIERKVIREPATAVQALLSGQIDVVGTNDPEWRQVIEAEGDKFRMIQMPDNAPEFLGFNCNNKYFKNPKIRIAFSLGFDREKYVEDLRYGLSEPLYSLIPSVINCGDMPYKERVGGRNEIVKELMEQYPDPRALLVEGLVEEGFDPDPSKMDVRYATRGTAEYSKKSAEWLQQQYEEILGVSIIIDMMEWNIMWEKVDQNDYDICTAGWGPYYNDPNALLEIFHPTDGYFDSTKTGWTGPDAEKYAELLEKASSSTDDDERAELFLEAEKLLVGTGVVAPTYCAVSTIYLADYVKGYYVSPVAGVDYTKIYTVGRP